MLNFRCGMSVYGCRGDGARGFYDLGTHANWWSSSVGGTGSWDRELNSGYTSVNRYPNARSNGFSVRCVREFNGMRFYLSEIISVGSIKSGSSRREK